jgi:polyphenol oxidase
VLLMLAGGSDLGLFEVNEAADVITQAAHPDANIIFGAVIDDSLGDEVKVTVIAAGFDKFDGPVEQQGRSSPAPHAVRGARSSRRHEVGAHRSRTTRTRRTRSSGPEPRRPVVTDVVRGDDDDDLDVPSFLAPLTPAPRGRRAGPAPPARRGRRGVVHRDATPRAPIHPVGRAGNLSHRRPHRPGRPGPRAGAAGAAMGSTSAELHLMRQCHGADVGVVDAATPPGAELDGVDALVTAELDRPLGGRGGRLRPGPAGWDRTVAAAHAGRSGWRSTPWARRWSPRCASSGTSPGTCARHRTGDRWVLLRGPRRLQATVAADHPDGAPRRPGGPRPWTCPRRSCAPRGARCRDVEQVGGCTRCDPDSAGSATGPIPTAGRQLGVVVRRGARRTRRPGRRADGRA